MPLHSEKLQRPGVAQYGAHMVVSEGLACQNMFLSIFLFFSFVPPPPTFFLPKWEGAMGSGYLGRFAFTGSSWRLHRVGLSGAESTPGRRCEDRWAMET